MINYIYDGTFEGLLSSIYEAYYSPEKPDRIIPMREFINNFLYSDVNITTNKEKYRKVYISIKSKISDAALENIYHAFLSEIPDISTNIYNYIRLGFKIGKTLDLHLTNETVLTMHKAASKVTSEVHRLLGLLRFKKIKGDIYYAAVEPDHNVISLLSPHFVERLRDQYWIIHDLKRGLAAVYDKRTFRIEHIYSKGNEPFNVMGIKEVDVDFEDLWKLYFKHITIESKRNINLQKQHMPKRYWGHLIEKTIVLKLK